MKIFWCDVETTGTDSEKHGLTQIAGLIEIDGEQKEIFNIDVKPFKGQMISKEALELTGKTVEDLERYIDPAEAYQDILGLITTYIDKFDRQDKMFFAGYNANFDMQFLRKFWENNHDKYFGSLFFFPYLDVMALAAWKLKDDRHLMENFKLTTIARHLGFEFDEEAAHDGLFDVRLTKNVYEYLQNPVNPKYADFMMQDK